jgi:hypothetical protein
MHYSAILAPVARFCDYWTHSSITRLQLLLSPRLFQYLSYRSYDYSKYWTWSSISRLLDTADTRKTVRTCIFLVWIQTLKLLLKHRKCFCSLHICSSTVNVFAVYIITLAILNWILPLPLQAESWCNGLHLGL